MATKISLEYCGMQGEGRTVKEAKQDAARKLEALVCGVQHGPRVIVVGACAIVVSRSLEGWNYMVVTDECGKPRRDPGRVQCNESLDSVRLRAVSHAAQNAWAHDIPNDREFIAQAMRENSITERDAAPAIDQFLRWCKFQRSYKALREAGKTDAEAFDEAQRGSWE